MYKQIDIQQLLIRIIEVSWNVSRHKECVCELSIWEAECKI